MHLRIVTSFLIAGLAFGMSPLARGASEAQSVPIYITAKAQFLAGATVAGNFTFSTDVEKPDGTFSTVAIVATVQTSGANVYNVSTPLPRIATLDVGRIYWLHIGTTRTSSVTLNVNPPAGYDVHFFDNDSAAQDNATREYKFPTMIAEQGWDGHFGTTLGLCITPTITGASGGQAGSATTLSTSGASWRIFMGYLPNGLSAGYLEMNDRGRATAGFTDAFNPNALAYIAPSPEIRVHSNEGGERRIFAYETGVWIKPLTSPAVGYTVSFYRNAQVTDASPPAAPSFSGTPFMVYTIQRDGTLATDLKITRVAAGAIEPITKVATIKRTGTEWNSYTFTLADWHTAGSAALVTATTVLSAGTGADDHDETITLASSAGGTSQVSAMAVEAVTIDDEVFGEFPTSATSGVAQPETRAIAYYKDDSTEIGAFARPKLVTSNDGNGPWSAYEYFSSTYSSSGGQAQFNNTGMVKRLHRPFKSTAAPAADDDLSTRTQGMITTYQYASDSYTQANGLGLRPSDELTEIGGVTVAHSTTTYTDASTLTYAGLSLPVVTATRTDYTAALKPLVTKTKYIREYSVSELPLTNGQYFGTTSFFGKQVLSEEKPDGTMQVYAYQRGTFNETTFVFTANNTASPFSTTPGSAWQWANRSDQAAPAASRIVVITGSATKTTGTSNTTYSSENGFPIEPVYPVNGKSTRTVTIRDRSALVRRTETWAYVDDAFQLVGWENLSYDSANNLVLKVSSTGATYEATYDGGRKTSETDAAGVKTTYVYDDAGRVSSAIKIGVSPNPDLQTDYAYDAAGRVISEDVHADGGTEHLITTHSYDSAGRISDESQPGKGTTTYAYVPASNQVTVGLPNGGSRVEISYADGQKKQITGNGVVAQYIDYEVEPTTGLRHTTVRMGGSNSSRTKETWTDWLGRETKSSHPTLVDGTAGVFVETRNYADTTGLLASISRTDDEETPNKLLADTFYGYDALGQLVRTQQHLDSGDTLKLDGSDRITDTNQFYERYPATTGEYWLTKQTLSYPTINSDVAQQISLTRQRLTGFSKTNLIRAETTTKDVNGNETDTLTSVNRDTKTTTVSTTATGYTNTASTVSVNGLFTARTGFDGLTTKTNYDGLQRPKESVDPQDRTTKTAFVSGTNLPLKITDPAQKDVATYGYDAAGRVTAVTNADSKVVRTKYNARDQILDQWGNATYPVGYAYNDYGERIAMRTFHGTNANDFNATIWPLTDGGSDANKPDPDLWTSGDKTIWSYDGATGLLLSKTDSASKSVEFTYNARGQTYQRKGARHVGDEPSAALVTATYAYDEATGELTGISYNDAHGLFSATPSVTYSYTRAGQLWRVVDGTSVGDSDYRQFVYNSTNLFQLDSVVLPAFYADRILTRTYDAIKRPAGFKLGIETNLSADLTQTYTYDPANGRFRYLDTAIGAQTSLRFTYGYKQVSDLDLPLIESITAGSFAVTRGYDASRDLLTSIDTKWDSVSRTRYDYTYNALGQRETATQSSNLEAGNGPFGAFADFGDATIRSNTFDARGELTDSADYLGTDKSVLANQLSGRHFVYSYDNIGSRLTASRTGTAGTADSYEPNALNQYASRTNNLAHTAGTVSNSAVNVGVVGSNGAVPSGVGRQGRYWAAQVLLNNGSSPSSSQLTVTATWPGAGSGGTDLVTSDNSRKALLPPSSQSFSYDDDGNMIGDDMWTYTYDAENRLIQMIATTAARNAGNPYRLLEFKYDYLGRRVQKHSKDYTANTETWRRYLYDGDVLIAEFAASGTVGTSCGSLQRSYTWGLDLAGSLTATGGVGALLQFTDHTTSRSYFPTYDGNGNVVSLLQATDGGGLVAGGLAAQYEYSPFGELLRCEGCYAISNPFQFSTKFTDDETGLAYYGHRYYSPSLGRFVNRDPIEEAGGLNLYGFCLNDPVDKYDLLGYHDFNKSIPKDEVSRVKRQTNEEATKRLNEILGKNGGNIRDAIRQLDQETGLSHTVAGTSANGATTTYLSEVSVTASAIAQSNGQSLAGGVLRAVNRAGYAPNNAPPGNAPGQTLNPPGASPLTGPVEKINAGNYQILTDGTKVQILVRVNYQGSAATPDVVAKFNQGIEAGWTGQFGKYSVSTFVTNVSDGPAFRPFVAPGEGTSNMNGTGLWYAGSDGWVAAHETGHGFGLPDRYEMYVRGNPPMPGYENNIMAVPGGAPSGADISDILTMARARQGKGP